VLCTLGNDDHIASLDIFLLASDNRLARARGEDEVLVDLVNLTGQ
jgi:hypothetical protein